MGSIVNIIMIDHAIFNGKAAQPAKAYPPPRLPPNEKLKIPELDSF
ncbi:MAG: hypothetical protein M3530_11200 [Thermoproteota archaeon]|nr:hypothetical protein [Thermoproteota archaeon]